MATRSASLRVSAARPSPGRNNRTMATSAAIRVVMTVLPQAGASLDQAIRNKVARGGGADQGKTKTAPGEPGRRCRLVGWGLSADVEADFVGGRGEAGHRAE